MIEITFQFKYFKIFIFVFKIKRKNSKNKTVFSLTITLQFYEIRDVNVSQLVATIISDFVNQQEIIKQNVPLGFACEIDASNIQITTSKHKIIRNFKINFRTRYKT